MKIISADIAMHSSRNTLEKHERVETLRAWVGQERPDFENNRNSNVVTNQ